uniref:Evolutionarily conserved signaling intermediate in Toll pathway, mitochondrial n=1 Tax=Globodera rostochiensis TaxID=31243 RepID=A0A914ICW5_GLORO
MVGQPQKICFKDCRELCFPGFVQSLPRQALRAVPKDEKTKEAFLKQIELFHKTRGRRGVGHVEFIEAALKHMQAYNLHKDLEIYKALMDVLPKGDLLPKRVIQRMFWHFPQQQACAIDLMDMMEWHSVQPDKEMHDLVASIFGKWNYATRKAKRQLYWLPKLKHTNKYLDRRVVENKKLEAVELAQIALRMMCRDAGTQISSFKAYYAEQGHEHHNWICTCHVDGPSRVWVQEHMLNYVVLSSAATVERDEEITELSVASHKMFTAEDLHKKLWEGQSEFRTNLHQQSDQTILAMAIFGGQPADQSAKCSDQTEGAETKLGESQYGGGRGKRGGRL